MSSVTIYHNPKCGTSRTVLEMIRAAGVEPVVVEYLRDPPDRQTLCRLIAQTGEPARALLRERGTPYAELGLEAPHWTEDQLVDFMLAHPILINRPLVQTALGARLCRPVERLYEILPRGEAPA